MATCTMEKRTEEHVVHQLKELFGNVLNVDIIKRVAVSCHYDVAESSNKLLEITSLPMESKEKKNIPKTVPARLSVLPVAPRKSKRATDIEKAINNIEKGYKVLVIMRGVPGCGKSYLAKSIVHSTLGSNCNYRQHILSTDDFFYQNGVYQFNSEQLSEAHGWNHQRAFNALSKGYSPIIIDNTNTQMWEMKPYAMMATDYGYIIEILEPDTHWSFNDKELAKRNMHGVPRSKIKDILERYEKNITPLKLLSAYNLSYKLQKPPQWRLYPPLQTNSLLTNFPKINISVPDNCNSLRGNLVKSKSVSIFNANETMNTKKGPVETINLMEFNDDENGLKLQPVIKTGGDEILTTSYTQKSVDDILMCNNDVTTMTSHVLQPLQQDVTEMIISDDSSDEENQKSQSQKNVFSDLETAWGVNENALRSWDIVTPIKDEVNTVQSPYPSVNKHIETKNSSCNTEEEYFRLLKNKSVDSVSLPIKVLDTINRDINRSTPKKEPAVLKKPMLDKSCLTEDIFENFDNHITQLINLFPTIPRNHLKYWYNKCKGDLEWTIEFLLEAKEDYNDLMEENNTEDKPIDEATPIEIDSDSANSDETDVKFEEINVKRTHKTSNESNEVIKLIESKIDINEEHYSKHLLKIKQFRFGSASILDNSQPSGKNIKCSPCMPQASTSKYEIIDLEDSDIEFDEFEIVDIADKTEEKREEMIELNLGNNFVSQLEDKFGDPNIGYPKGFQPVVQVPVTLARQLYTFYIESVYQQMDTQKQILETLVKEDEEFAKKLQAREDEESSSQINPTPNLQQIMHEQVAQSIYQKEAGKWKDLNVDNLAARLTQQKLFSVFPNVDKNTLVEILYAHDNKYQDTVEILLASTGTDNIRGNIDSIIEPPLKEEVIQEMREAQESSINKEYEEQYEATFYREEANRYLKRRAEFYQKAQQYHQRNMTEVAQFYSGLACQQTVYFDRANNLAATAFLDEHSKRLQDFNTLDLHFLYVKEAIPALDLFLDRNINLLRLSGTKQSENLQIITGRGKRSENGISKIRPAVITRLKRRQIKFVQLNPGLLKVKVTNNSVVTSEILKC